MGKPSKSIKQEAALWLQIIQNKQSSAVMFYVSQSVRMKFPPSPANLQSSHTCGGPLLPLCYIFFALVCYSSPSLWRYAWYCIGRCSLTEAKYFCCTSSFDSNAQCTCGKNVTEIPSILAYPSLHDGKIPHLEKGLI